MPYHATPEEWLALSAVAQQPSQTLRMWSLRTYLHDYLGNKRAASFVHNMIKGGLLEYVDDAPTLAITEWGLMAHRSAAPSSLPAYLPIPESIVNARLKTH